MTMERGLQAAVSRLVWHPLHLRMRGARPPMRASYEAYRASLAFRRASIVWSADRKAGWVLDSLRRTVRHAAATTPFYRDRLSAIGFDPRADFGFEDLAALPVLERADIHDAGDAIRSTAVPEHLVRRDATGGSTGTPTRLWTGPRERGWSEGANEHYMRRVGLERGRRIAYLWGHHLDPVARSTARERLEDWLTNTRWYDCLRLSDELLLRYHADLQRRRPDGIVAYASSLAALAEAVERSGDRPAYPLRAFVTGAEKLFPHQRALVEGVFEAPVHERYGARDAGLMAFQATAGSLDFEVNWSNVLVEPETPVADGEPAAILVTKLQADAMPMIRYRVGDLARFAVGARPGHPAFTLHEIVGRDVQRLWLPDGGWFHGLSFPHMLKDFPVRDFQVAQAEDLSVEVRIVPGPEFSTEHETAIVGTVRANLPGVPVTLRRVDAIPRTRANKWQPVTSAARGPRAAHAGMPA